MAHLALRRARGEVILDVDAPAEHEHKSAAGVRAALVLDELGKLQADGRLNVDQVAAARLYYSAWHKSLPGNGWMLDSIRVPGPGAGVTDRMMSAYVQFSRAYRAMAPDERPVVDRIVLHNLSLTATRTLQRLGYLKCLRLLQYGLDNLDRHFRT